ncbi:MAG TPA: phospholipase D family protein [Rhodanobacteraceae bacterium]|nr:phospholipase D family protein [Rhodanobacteraceae bacterium]
MRARLLWLCVSLAALVLGACTRSDLRPDFVREASTSLPAHDDSPLAAYAERLSSHAAHARTDSGMRLLGDSVDALIARIAMADRAKYSIDLQYYLFHNDATGRLVAQHLLMAADRGVRVRVLVDDLAKVGHDAVLRSVDAHPNLEIRVFNPFHERSGSLWGIGKQFAGDFSRLNRRMHNKTFIVDGAIAVVGGRNIGDEYFDASDSVNFRDLDVMLVGPVVAEIAASFDRFWNSEPSVPIAAFRHDAKDEIDPATIRDRLSKSAREVRDADYGRGVIARAGDLKREDPADEWAWGTATFLSDDPDKVLPDVDPKDLHLAPRVRAWLDVSKQRILLVSPYFIPGDKGVAYLAGRRAAGVSVSVLTNSLASTDAGNVYAAYAKYRPPLLAAGVALYELKPNAAHRKGKDKRFIGSSSSSLHSKAIIADDDVFIGSMNLDPRSRSLNTEDGVIATSPVLAKALADLFALATTPEVTYHVKLREGSTTEVYWSTIEDGKPVTFDESPETSAWRRFKVGLTRIVPIEGLL